MAIKKVTLLTGQTFDIGGDSLPDGGSTGQVLTKESNADGDAGWEDIPSINDQTPTFSQASSRTNIASGEKLSVIFGKIMKFFADLKTVAFTGSYSDLSDKPTIPTVNNATLTVQLNGTSKGTFTANASSNVTINLTKADIADLMFPVNSIYVTYTNSDPSNFIGKGTWSLVTSTVITSVTENVFGNGKALALVQDTGSTKYGLGLGYGNTVANHFSGYTQLYGKSVGSDQSAATGLNGYHVVGVPTKAQLGSDNYSNSGLIVERSSTTIYIWRRTA